MAWQDRIQTAAYTSPSGTRFEFDFENVSVEVDKKTTVFTFPEKDGAFIQDLGRAGRRFPFVVFFSGEDYDQEADSFLLALEEKGAGKLEHPLYGDRVVVPTGTITRRDDLVTGANQAAFSISFSETIEEVTFPISSISSETVINNAAEAFQEETAEQFAESIQIDNATEGVSLQNTAIASVTAIDQPLNGLARLQADIGAAYDTVKVSYEENVKNVVNDAAGVIRQGVALTRIPSQVLTSISNEINSYTDLITGLTAEVKSVDGTNNPANTFLYSLSLAGAALTALCESSIISIIATRLEAVNASEVILDLLDTINTWSDNNQTSLGIIDTGESYSALTEIVSQAAKYLVNISFDLPQERREVLQNDRNIIEFLASVGLSVETDLDFFIQVNDLTADEIEILPKGFEAVYYVR